MIRPTNRRELLRASLALGLSTAAGRVWAAPRADARLLVVFLRGAYDAANVVIPTGSELYYRARPKIAVARPDPASPEASLPLDADWSLHPALRDTLHPLYAAGQVAFVPFAGTDDATRSHFQTQDTIELGQTFGAGRDYRSGFMARLAAELTRTRPIAFTEQRPLIFQGTADGEIPVPNVAVGRTGAPILDERQSRLIAAMYEGNPLAPAVQEGFRVRGEVFQAISAHQDQADRGAVSPKGFALAAERIGRLMREQFNLGFVDVGGWDTHVGQGGAKGYLANQLTNLGQGLAAFAREIGPGWNDTVVVVLSEFGRTFRENGGGGTDHGYGSAYWILGGPVHGGRIAGPQRRLDEGALFEHRDLPVLTNYRALLAGLLQRLYGLDQASLGRIFPGAAPVDLGLV